MSDALKIYLDGEIVDQSEAKVSVFDHGLLYGDGVFEGIRFYNGRVFHLVEHIERLFDSAKALLIEIPLSKQEVIELTCKTIRANELRDGYVRLIVTRGPGSLGLSPYTCPTPSIICIASTIKLYPEEKYEHGLTLATCSTRRPTHGSLSPLVKSLNYLSNVMAKIECIAAGAEEGVMLNEQGMVAECTGDNIFVIKNGKISTPPVSAGSLDGITRRVVIELAAELGFELNEVNMTRYELYTADELFLTGTAAEVVPVAKYDERDIGTGTTGPITRQFMEAFSQLTRSTGTPIYEDAPEPAVSA